MANNITLTASMRSNLSSLKSLNKKMGTTQTRLSTGKKVNDAIDNASSYYQSRALSNRSKDLDALLDSMGQSIQTIQASIEGIEAGLKMIEQMNSMASATAMSSFVSSYFEADPEFDGRVSSPIIIDQLQEKGLAARATSQFYAPGVSSNDGDWGQGKWYLPSACELVDIYNHKTAINRAFTELYNIDRSVSSTIGTGTYWSSSESGDNTALTISMSNGNVSETNKSTGLYVRALTLLENKFVSDDGFPIIGDVVYSDMTYGSARDYNPGDVSKTLVGVVTWVSDDGGSARVINLKDFKFSTYNQPNNFNPGTPYTGSSNYAQWCTSDIRTYNVEGLDDIRATELNAIYTTGNKGTWVVDDKVSRACQQFNNMYDSFNKMINDASYQGINLLNGNNLTVIFNETRTNGYVILGKNADALSLGITKAKWNNVEDMQNTILQLQNATELLRNISEQLGNDFSIIKTRQNFTDGLIDVLQTGADNLVLAEINEESANYLALQTRQQLAVNALALASESSNSILSLF